MELTLKQQEIELAIQNHVRKLFTNTDGFEFNVDLRAGRGIDGFTATVDISEAGSLPPPKTVVPKPSVTRTVEPATEEVNMSQGGSVIHVDLASGPDTTAVVAIIL